MKRFVVLSDSHGRINLTEKLGGLFAENDAIVHLGDGSTDMRPVFCLYPEKTYICRGNCDFFYGESEYIIEAEGVRIFCCHGHSYGVKSGLERLATAAKEKDCTVALYGHTHIASIEKTDGVLCINPGSAGAYVNASYCYLVIHRGNVTPTIVPIY